MTLRAQSGVDPKSPSLQSGRAGTQRRRRVAKRTAEALAESPARRRATKAGWSSALGPARRKTAVRPVGDGPSRTPQSLHPFAARQAAARAVGGGRAWHSSCALYRKSNRDSAKRAYAHKATGDVDSVLGLGLGLLASWGVTARAEDKPPVLVGYVQKLLPDRDGGDREVGWNRPAWR
jgi:hypothetical protein